MHLKIFMNFLFIKKIAPKKKFALSTTYYNIFYFGYFGVSHALGIRFCNS